MSEEKAPDTVIDYPDLLVPPHVVTHLMQLVVGERTPDQPEREHLEAHCSECLYCRTFLITVVQAYERLRCGTEAPALDLAAWFVPLPHELEAQDYEQMGAYAEALASIGREADKRFPILAEHTRGCLSCKYALESLLIFLTEHQERDEVECPHESGQGSSGGFSGQALCLLKFGGWQIA